MSEDCSDVYKFTDLAKLSTLVLFDYFRACKFSYKLKWKLSVTQAFIIF